MELFSCKREDYIIIPKNNAQQFPTEKTAYIDPVSTRSSYSGIDHVPDGTWLTKGTPFKTGDGVRIFKKIDDDL